MQITCRAFPGKYESPTLSPPVIYAVAVGRLEQNNLPWLTDTEERNGRNHYFPVKISLKQRGAELCMLRGVFGSLINSRGPISPSKAVLIISSIEKAALNTVEMILQQHIFLSVGDLQAFCRIILLKLFEYTGNARENSSFFVSANGSRKHYISKELESLLSERKPPCLLCCLSKPWCSPLAAGDILCITRSSSNKRHPSWVFYESAD